MLLTTETITKKSKRTNKNFALVVLTVSTVFALSCIKLSSRNGNKLKKYLP